MNKRNERGAVIVEASIVFPVMFLVIFFMIYAGNVFLQKCHVESIINQYAMEGAAYCADPMLSKVSGGIPTANNWEVYPYRAFDGNGVGDMNSTVEGKIEASIKKMDSGLFSGMKPRNCKVTAKYNNHIIYSTFAVDVNYDIRMPIRLLGEKENMMVNISAHVDVPVSDSPELIRNIEMVKDFAEGSETVDKISNKISEVMDKAKEWFTK